MIQILKGPWLKCLRVSKIMDLAGVKKDGLLGKLQAKNEMNP